MTYTNCGGCNGQMKNIPAGTSKKTGRPYNAFQVCEAGCGWQVPKEQKTFTPGPSKMGQIKELQENKAGFIKQAQERKDESIAWFNATNSAIQMLDRSLPMDDGKKQMLIRYWRAWFLSEWNSRMENEPPFN